MIAHLDGRLLESPGGMLELSRAWNFEPGIVIALALTLGLYLHGYFKQWRRSPGRGTIRWPEIMAFFSGWLTLFLALLSPLHPLGNVLFCAHMTQHELLMLVAAPLLVLGRPLVPFLWALPKGWARKLSQSFHQSRLSALSKWFITPFSAWVIHAVILWSWHLPTLFQATLRNNLIHSIQHVSFLGSALLFWWALFQGPQRALGFGVAVLYLFTTALHSGLLGALLTFAPSVWYPIYTPTTAAWGLTPLEDQQIGGLIMWIPAGTVYLIAGLALFAGWLQQSERTAHES